MDDKKRQRLVLVVSVAILVLLVSIIIACWLYPKQRGLIFICTMPWLLIPVLKFKRYQYRIRRGIGLVIKSVLVLSLIYIIYIGFYGQEKINQQILQGKQNIAIFIHTLKGDEPNGKKR